MSDANERWHAAQRETRIRGDVAGIEREIALAERRLGIDPGHYDSTQPYLERVRNKLAEVIVLLDADHGMVGSNRGKASDLAWDALDGVLVAIWARSDA